MPHASPGRKKRLFLLGTACLQNSLTGGLLFGFSALRPAIEKINGSGVNFGQVFTTSISANLLAPLLLAGPILDLFGPRVCSCVSTVTVGLGFLLFGASSYLPGCAISYLMPSMILIGVGSPGCQCCLFHTANLFESRGAALNLITSCIGFSFVIFELLAAWSAWQSFSLQAAFLLYSSLPFTCGIVGFFIMPDSPFSYAEIPAGFNSPTTSAESPLSSADVTPFPSPVERQVAQPRKHRISFGSARPMVFIRRKRTAYRRLRENESFADDSKASMRLPLCHVPDDKRSNLLDQVCSHTFVELASTFVVTSFFANLFLGNMQDEAEANLSFHCALQSEAAAKAANYVSTYFRFSPLSTLLNPLLGYCIDRFGIQCMLAITLFLGSLYAFALWLGSFFIGATLFSIFSSSYFAYTYSCLAFEFGFEYYGLLAGIIQSIGSVSLFILQPYAHRLAAVYGWPRLQIIQIAVVSLFGLLLISLRLIRRNIRQRWSTRRDATGEGVDASLPGPVMKSQEGMQDLLNRSRAYSEGDMHTAEEDQPCRRRPGLFPHADDILVIDGAYSHHSHAAYLLESLTDKEKRSF